MHFRSGYFESIVETQSGLTMELIDDVAIALVAFPS